MASNIPSIPSAAQARLLVYQLLSAKLDATLERFLKSDPKLWEALVEELQSILLNQGQTAAEQALLERTFNIINEKTKLGLKKQIEVISGETLLLRSYPTELLHRFTKEHSKLIKSVNLEQLSRIENVVQTGLRQGLLTKDLGKNLTEQTKICKKKAQLIARNSALQYSGSLTKHHQISAGINFYVWETSQDERVRKTHQAKKGKKFSWDDPGPHPRSEVNCRCDAIPVLDL